MTTTTTTTMTPGQRLFPVLVDHLATSNPTQRVGLIPKGADVSDGFETITMQRLARAVDAFAFWIEKQVGRATEPQTIAYMASNDVRYLIFLLAAHKTGYKPLLPSTRLSDDAYQHILNATDCHTFLSTPEKQRRVAEIQAFRQDTAFFEVPSIAELLDAKVEHYPYTKTYREAEDDVAIIIHSSGTTGMPKPVPLTHGFLATLDYGAYLSRPQSRQCTMFNDLPPDTLVLSTTPFFHLMGLLAFTESLFHHTPFIVLPDKPLSVDLISSVITTTRPTAALLPPSILEDISHVPSARTALSTLQYVYFAGAPLSPEVGDDLSQLTKIITVLGSSEMGLISSFVPQGTGVWGYFEWNPAYGVDMQHVNDGLYELVIPRRADSRQVHGIFHTFPERTEYRSNDLFVQHPERPELWKYHGRLDDVIVLSNGEKLNPVTLEKIVEGHPRVQRALLIGQARFDTALLVEPNWAVEGDIDEKEFVESIWETVERANEAVPKYGRIVKSRIRLAHRKKPFKTTAKGTTQRHAVNKEYKEEIEAIYAAAEEEAAVEMPDTLDAESLRVFVHDLVAGLLEREDIREEEDLYAAGMDSLQTIQLAKTLNKAVSARCEAGRDISQQQIYSHPSVAQLAQYLLDLVTGTVGATISRAERITTMLEKYTNQLPQRTTSAAPLSDKSTVILTGSTGSLGTYLLHRLLSDPTTAKVYCFNRSSAAERQKRGFAEKGLGVSLLESPRVEFLQVSFGAEHFGLPAAKYSELLQSVDFIIHNAWKVNFNHPLESFEDPHLKGVYQFIRFSTQSTHNAHLSFVSSVSTIGGWTASLGPVVPEAPLETVDAVLEQGYGESKHVAERMCLAASRQANVPTTVFRVGQISGPTTVQGLWNLDEWVPTLVKTSKAVGKVPSDLGGYLVDWVPVDTLATITTELMHTRRQNQSHTSHAVYHLVNPSKTAWSTLVPAIEARYPGIEAIPLDTWLNELEAIKNPSESEVHEKPALKLLDFYRGLAGEVLSAEISVERTRGGSRTMEGLGAVTEQLMGNWLEQWDF
ncbi:NRPS-like enzyme [Aspergillus sclerotioniger CBS 115572]|uniref:NRPS-like enzyme n=1 Tax=Aspergillus sclerotioniger CBS 115572 TaxID=1450535 RepID=A0A317VS49_9EURO|nr:NRPS-like enzyme [Aspergillus sclerotioniger CBS 115572]PWY76131.1 NRPS-like enzyme [Aspergillus sclerotioniger CBS 115572]